MAVRGKVTLFFIIIENFKYIKSKAGDQWLTPVILATWEAEIGRIMV
jgi:hypothetical protein